jgi:hypothetical protein
MIATMAGFQVGVLKPDPPIMAYVTTGQFSISNYNPTLIYVATLTTGSGTATLNTSTGIYSLSGANSRFSVLAKYGAGAPDSDLDFMERKQYEYTYRDAATTCSRTVCLKECSCGCSAPDPSTGGCPPGTSPNTQCGCGQEGRPPCMFGCIGCEQEGPESYPCTERIYDVLVQEPGYIDSGVEWYKVS